jgi:hypothetical protein
VKVSQNSSQKELELKPQNFKNILIINNKLASQKRKANGGGEGGGASFKTVKQNFYLFKKAFIFIFLIKTSYK